MADARSYIDGIAARGPRNDDKKHSSGYNRLPW